MAQNIEFSFGCVARGAVLLKSNVSNILLFNFCEQKSVQHGPITIATAMIQHAFQYPFKNLSAWSLTPQRCMRVAFYISGFGNPSVAIYQLTALSYSLTFLSLYVLRTFWHMSAICVVYSNLNDRSRSKNGIKSWTFSCDYFLQLSTWINSTTVHQQT